MTWMILSTALLWTSLVLPQQALGTAVDSARLQAEARAKYTKAHSLADAGKPFNFSTRDGWQTINITDLNYKYQRNLETAIDQSDTDLKPNENRFENHEDRQHSSGGHHFWDRKTTKTKKKGKKHSKKPTKKPAKKNHASKVNAAAKGDSATTQVLANVDGAVKDLSQIMSGIGEKEDVIITWYTGEDLLNPSCWPESDWAPTDASFVAALTLDGWTSKPQCFKFLEICHTPQKCIFVRVVDTCAGCASGSKHVDLTRAAFGELADFDEGILTVQMRLATDPNDDWFDELWGPKPGAN
ncbi:hypothetical protein PUNSTDRAFT_132799 [Punctularia strigosozonata HHB-11173 SS5]|uniref:uncharacterized protein n=1 Tax=Punctularia strigosozonata (strain HHB-11173) TaxID=741275 RepID=UPI00044173FD|nr:uncharacterized protein PUNSTDRAFT_132799 [Punctularia strigosozonata HHB-11173 SS5]EIN10725.1 hypothetical protein PUNSTDRAFT_132799 [Punctularia strigosozonata HHB-11173 SS5]